MTDQRCRKAWSVQVKTNRKAAPFWLVNAHTGDFYSASHGYVFVNLKGDSRPDYFVVPSSDVAPPILRVIRRKTGSVWYSVHQKDLLNYAEGWAKVFADSSVDGSDGSGTAIEAAKKHTATSRHIGKNRAATG